MERTKSEKECSKLQNVKLFNIARADSAQGEKMSLGVSIYLLYNLGQVS